MGNRGLSQIKWTEFIRSDGYKRGEDKGLRQRGFNGGIDVQILDLYNRVSTSETKYRLLGTRGANSDYRCQLYVHKLATDGEAEGDSEVCRGEVNIKSVRSVSGLK